MSCTSLPARFNRDVTLILVDQSPNGTWGVHDNHGLDRRFAERAEALRLANTECRNHPGSVVLAMPPLLTATHHDPI